MGINGETFHGLSEKIFKQIRYVHFYVLAVKLILDIKQLQKEAGR